MIQKIDLKLYGNQPEVHGTSALMSVNYLTRKPDNIRPYKSETNFEPHARKISITRFDLKSKWNELTIMTRIQTKLAECRVAL
jgi:hypothetical protein